MSESHELPECLSIVICDRIYRDEKTKNLILAGTFNTISLRSIPSLAPPMSVLFTLTQGRGNYDMALKIEHADSNEAILEMRGPLALTDPLQIADFHVDLAGIEFRSAGKYFVSIYIDGAPIKMRPFTVVDLTTEKGQGHG